MTKAFDPSGETERLVSLLELDLLHGQTFPELDRLTALANDICGANIAAFTVHDATRAFQISTSFGAREIMPRRECICSVSFESGTTVVLDDARATARASKYRHVVQEPFVRSYAGVPVVLDAGRIIGVLAVGHTDPAQFGPEEVERLERVAELVSAFLTTRRDAIRAHRAASQTEAERARQVQFELIFNAIHEGVNVFAADGKIIETNSSAAEILGLAREQQLGRAIVDPRWKTTKPDGSPFPTDEHPVVRALRAGEMTRNVRMGLELPTGEQRWISVNAAPIRNVETDAIEYVVATFKDMTAQYETERRINAQNAKLAEALTEAEKANRAKTDFMGVMSHELRTPMNAVLACAKLLMQSKLDPVQLRTLGVLEDAGRQMAALLNDLFDLSSLNADKVRIEREPVSLVRLIEDAAVIWAADVKAKSLSLSVMIDPALVAPRSIDPARLLQIIGNLMANAVKFTTTGGITIQAWPEGRKDGAERIAIEVEDTGPGVPKEAVERIFSPFEQVDVSSKRRHGGLGLGLHVARRLAVAMGGDIALETRPGEGSRFIVSIAAPLCEAAAPAGPADADESEMQVKEILCVDDNPRNLYVIGAILKAAGHRTTEVSSGADALRELASHKFDVIMLDMVMPDMDGLDVLANLRGNGGINQATPVIACTANVLPDQIAAYSSAGTISVLAKPIDVKAMLQAVAAA